MSDPDIYTPPNWRPPVKTKLTMFLDNKKVVKFFGSHPERGRPIPGLPMKRVTVGVKWSLPKKDWVYDDDVLVKRTLALKHIKKNVWEVQVDPQFKETAVLFLMKNCQ